MRSREHDHVKREPGGPSTDERKLQNNFRTGAVEAAEREWYRPRPRGPALGSSVGESAAEDRTFRRRESAVVAPRSMRWADVYVPHVSPASMSPASMAMGRRL